MDRLRALVGLRWRLDFRILARARERGIAWLLMLPGLLLFSGITSLLVFTLVRGAAGQDLLLPALSALATAVGLSWALSPLLAGVAVTESHDMTRLMHFPIPLLTLVTSSLLANLTQPLVLAEMPVMLALAVALASGTRWLPLSLFGVGLSFAFVLGTAQVMGLLLQGISRNRRVHDWALFLGLAVGFLISLVPLLLLASGARVLQGALNLLTRSELLALSPFAWGVRAAVHGGRGDVGGFLAWSALGSLALGAAVALSSYLVGRIHRGELDLGRASRAGSAAPARMRFADPLGALVEKDLRAAWRDPALKATLFIGMLGPVVFLMMVSANQARSGRSLLMLASLVGISSFGANVFGLERRGIGLLLGFPIPRWRILVAKNLGSLVLRLPGLLTLGAAALVLAPAPFLAAALTIALSTILLSSAMDNYVSILFPVAAPAPGSNPYGPQSGARGLSALLLSAALLLVTLLLSSPFAFLAWLPLLLGQPWLWAFSLPLALLGALAVYAMLVAGAERLLLRRESELLERILGEA